MKLCRNLQVFMLSVILYIFDEIKIPEIYSIFINLHFHDLTIDILCIHVLVN